MPMKHVELLTTYVLALVAGERVLPEVHEYEWGASTPAASLSESGIDVQVDHPETDEEDDIRGHCGAGEARIVSLSS